LILLDQDVDAIGILLDELTSDLPKTLSMATLMTKCDLIVAGSMFTEWHTWFFTEISQK